MEEAVFCGANDKDIGIKFPSECILVIKEVFLALIIPSSASAKSGERLTTCKTL